MESFEKMPIPEKKEESSIKRVIGVPKDKEKKIKDMLTERFLKQEFPDFKEKGIKEIEKTPEQIEIIKHMDKLTNDVLEKFGLPKFEISPNNVHILEKEDYKKINKEWKKGEAFYAPYYQAVFVEKTLSMSDLELKFAKKIFREYTRFKSFQINRFYKDKGVFDLGQDGMLIRTKTPKREYFRNLNEAVTEELTKKVFNKEVLNKEVLKLKNPKLFELFQEKIEEVEEARKIRREKKVGGDPDEILSVKTVPISLPGGEKGVKTKIETFSYFKQRKILNNLIEKLYSKNKDKFKDKEMVFGLFAESLFTGKLKWARLVNETFGVGTLQKLAKLDKDIEKLDKFIESL